MNLNLNFISMRMLVDLHSMFDLLSFLKSYVPISRPINGESHKPFASRQDNIFRQSAVKEIHVQVTAPAYDNK